MSSYQKIYVETTVDGCGQTIPVAVSRDQNKYYKIKRILHMCFPEDNIIRYTVLIGRSTKYLFYNGKEWRLSAPL